MSDVLGIGIVALSYVPLLASELQTQFHESREALAFIAEESPDGARRVLDATMDIRAEKIGDHQTVLRRKRC